MSNFILDYRKKPERCSEREIIQLIKYFDDIKISFYEFDPFTLAIASMDDAMIWGPYLSYDENIFIFLSGRISLDKQSWLKIDNKNKKNGLACKYIYDLYSKHGINSLYNLNGHYTIFIFDKKINRFYILTDRCGMSLCYQHERFPVYASNPDIVSSLTNSSQNDWDYVSLAEFLVTSQVTYPNTYYKTIKSLENGCIYEFFTKDDCLEFLKKTKYFDFDFNINHRISEYQLVEELEYAFKNAINRRILPIFGQTAISLSGGLDSRAFICAANDKNNMWSFCFFDEENLEYTIAKTIAERVKIRFIPLKRDFEHYGNHAELCVKISGGMGNIGNNHYLGWRKKFKELGIDNIITGFYCDYLFKGLDLNKKSSKILRLNKLTNFKYGYYSRLYWHETNYSEQVKERLDAYYTSELRNNLSELNQLKIENKRIFPLAYEPDHCESIVPQRVMGWYLPIVDNDIIDVYLRIPPSMKINMSLYLKMVYNLCKNEIPDIINANTGAKVNANRYILALYKYKNILKKRIFIHSKSIAAQGSWPNWEYYLNNSMALRNIWQRKNVTANYIIEELLGKNYYNDPIHYYSKSEIGLLLRLLTLKIWFDLKENII